MIIYFDKKSSKIRFLQQQSGNCFVVDFLWQDDEKLFKQELANLLRVNSEILRILKKDKNTIVLPNEIIATDTITLPNIKNENFFETKFQTLYGDLNSYEIKKAVLCKDKNAQMFACCFTKKNIINSIKNAFEQNKISIKNITFFDQCLVDYVSKKKNITKCNYILAYAQSENICFDYVANNIVVMKECHNKNGNKVANNFVINQNKFVNENYNNNTKSRKNSENLTNFSKKYAVLLENFKNYLKSQKINFNLDKILFLNFREINTDITNQDNEFIGEIISTDIDNVLLSAKTKLFIKKRRFWF